VARAIQIGGLESNGAAWLKELVAGIMANTPHSWPSHTLQNFPLVSSRVSSPVLQRKDCEPRFLLNPNPKFSLPNLDSTLRRCYVLFFVDSGSDNGSLYLNLAVLRTEPSRLEDRT
jgi:hypothetical protein